MLHIPRHKRRVHRKNGIFWTTVSAYDKNVPKRKKAPMKTYEIDEEGNFLKTQPEKEGYEEKFTIDAGDYEYVSEPVEEEEIKKEKRWYEKIFSDDTPSGYIEERSLFEGVNLYPTGQKKTFTIEEGSFFTRKRSPASDVFKRINAKKKERDRLLAKITSLENRDYSNLPEHLQIYNKNKDLEKIEELKRKGKKLNAEIYEEEKYANKQWEAQKK